jgi:UDP-N-acetylglucosamine 3-dehydrogenase
VTLRVGLVGLGAMGKNHLRVLQSLPNVRLVAVADVDTKACLTVTGPAVFPTFDLLLSVDLDAVVIATPTFCHYEQVAATLRVGIATFVEKPLAGIAGEALALAQLAQALHVPLAVGHIERFNPAVRRLCEILPLIGTLHFVESRRSGLREARTRSAVGVGMELATHDVDVISHLVGEQPKQAYASIASIHLKSGREDLLSGILRYPSGVVASVSADWLSPHKVRKIRALGTNGSFELDYISQKLTLYHADGTAQEVEVIHEEPLVAEMTAFFRALEGNDRTVAVSANDGAWAVRVVEALLASGRSGRPVDL